MRVEQALDAGIVQRMLLRYKVLRSAHPLTSFSSISGFFRKLLKQCNRLATRQRNSSDGIRYVAIGL
jgi:hypothetical protein